MSKLFNKYYSILCQEASKSEISSKLAACILKDKKMVSKARCNTSRNFCRGLECGSLHAEANAILTYFGKSLQFDPYIKRWYLLWNKLEKYKKT